MKIILILAILIIGGVVLAFRGRFQAPKNLISQSKMSFYDLSIPGLTGDTIHMKDYEGKYILCVNVASKCGFTPQYEGLETLYEKFEGKLVILGFPCNQFLFQEPGSSGEIAEFCQKNYGVTFPLSEKLDVKGKNQSPIYQWLTMKSLNGVSDAEVKWNFNKFLISPKGEWVKYFASDVEPMSVEISSLIK